MLSRTRLCTQVGVLDYDQLCGGLAQPFAYGRAFSTILFGEDQFYRAELWPADRLPELLEKFARAVPGVRRLLWPILSPVGMLPAVTLGKPAVLVITADGDGLAGETTRPPFHIWSEPGFSVDLLWLARA
jgi:hypothetical protein